MKNKEEENILEKLLKELEQSKNKQDEQTSQLANGFNLILNGSNKIDEESKDKRLAEIRKTVERLLIAEVERINVKMQIFGDDLKAQYKLLDDEREKVLVALKNSDLFAVFNQSKYDVSEPVGLWQLYNNIPDYKIKHLTNYHLGREMLYFLTGKLDELGKQFINNSSTEKKTIISGQLNGVEDLSKLDKPKRGRKAIEKGPEPTFESLFLPKYMELPRRILADLEKDKLTENGKWVGYDSKMDSDVVGFIRALEHHEFLFPRISSTVWEKIIETQFLFEVSSRTIRREPPGPSFSYYKKYLKKYL